MNTKTSNERMSKASLLSVVLILTIESPNSTTNQENRFCDSGQCGNCFEGEVCRFKYFFYFYTMRAIGQLIMTRRRIPVVEQNRTKKGLLVLQEILLNKRTYHVAMFSFLLLLVLFIFRENPISLNLLPASPQQTYRTRLFPSLVRNMQIINNSIPRIDTILPTR
jgi:hypothetical protein